MELSSGTMDRSLKVNGGKAQKMVMAPGVHLRATSIKVNGY